MGKGTTFDSEPVRRSAKAFGAISAEPDPRWYFRFAEKFNAKTFLQFLKQLVRNNNGRKVLLVLDNVRYHHAKLVKSWVKDNEDIIELHFLPAYSPDLNAVEPVWRLTKRQATHNLHFPKLGELHKKLFRRFNRYQGNPAALRGVIAPFLQEQSS